jgi:ABC-type Fe3+ transport system substrate-binding protein
MSKQVATVQHPSTQQAMRKAAERWRRLKDEHRAACDRLWVGTLANQFTDFELGLLHMFLSPYDKQALRSVGNCPPEGKS